MLLTLGVFLALAGGTLAVTGAFDGDQSTVSAAKDQYKPKPPKPPKGPKGPKGNVRGAEVGGGVGAGVGVGAGGAGAGAGAGGVAGADEGVCPTSLRITSGTLLSGTAADLCTRNQERLIIRSGSPTDFVAKYENVPGSSLMGVRFTGSSLKQDCDVVVSLFDYDAKNGKGDWVEAMSSKLGRTPKSLERDLPGAGKYVENGEARARVRCAGGEFLERTDHLVLVPG